MSLISSAGAAPIGGMGAEDGVEDEDVARTPHALGFEAYAEEEEEEDDGGEMSMLLAALELEEEEDEDAVCLLPAVLELEDDAEGEVEKVCLIEPSCRYCDAHSCWLGVEVHTHFLGQHQRHSFLELE